MSEQNAQEVSAADEAKPEVTESLDEQMAKSFEKHAGAGGATETAPTETEEEAEAEPAAETTEDEPGVETATETKVEWTATQFGDTKFYDSLDKAGWERLKTEFPEVYGRVKAAYSAASKLYDSARRSTTPEPKPAEERTNEKPTLSPELKAAWQKSQSLDEEEAAEGAAEYHEMLLRQALPKFGVDPDEAVARRVAKTAYGMAIKGLPDLASISDADLDAAVEADEDLLDLLEVAATSTEKQRVRITASVMKRAGQAVLAKQKAKADSDAATKRAADAKTADRQQRERSNAQRIDVVTEASTGRAPTTQKSIEETLIKNMRERGQAV